MSKTTIQWTERTWNPVRGCSRVSPGCENCYAERQAGRFCWGIEPCDVPPGALQQPNEPFYGFARRTPSGPRWTGRVGLMAGALEIPLRRRKPTTWFVNSMSDLFHEALFDEDIDQVFAVMALCPQHTFQVLTKRAERMAQYFAAANLLERLEYETHEWMDRHEELETCLEPWPLPNVWLGVSVEDQKWADERIPHLLRTPAVVRFISAEPLLGNFSFNGISWPPSNRGFVNALTGQTEFPEVATRPHAAPPVAGLDWVIVGGESGPGSRPCDVNWIRSIVRQCAVAGVPCFVKQLGPHPYDSEHARQPYFLHDRKGGDPAEWPEDLCVRQLPEVCHG